MITADHRMPRRRPKQATNPLREVNISANVLQTNKITHKAQGCSDKKTDQTSCDVATVDEIAGLKSILEVKDCQPSTSSTLLSTVDNLSTNTADLYNELDSFRLRWKRELEETKQPESKIKHGSKCNENLTDEKGLVDESHLNDKESSGNEDRASDGSDQIYAKAKKLFLIAVEFERDEMHHESIRYYKQAMHLCPDIEKQIFREQCEASAEAAAVATLNGDKPDAQANSNGIESSEDIFDPDGVSLFERVRQNYNNDEKNRCYAHCRPSYKPKTGTIHISDLPPELILQVYHYIVGEELDLASLESVGLVCRGFYLLTKDPSLWRSICFTTWAKDTNLAIIGRAAENDKENSPGQSTTQSRPIDWRQMFMDRPRVNFDGVYISRTRYIRQGDVGFQDLSYRPFHVIRYYRYVRFFPDRRVLILTTNEEPDKIIPIFRHALNSKQFSPELSILEGKYEFTNINQISIEAEKDCRSPLALTQNQRRQAQFHWSRQTPLTQKFNLKFQLRTSESKPYKNNVLRWLEYTILSRLEAGQEVTVFEVTPDTFPNLIFSRVKRFNLKLMNPLSSH